MQRREQILLVILLMVGLMCCYRAFNIHDYEMIVLISMFLIYTICRLIYLMLNKSI